MSKPFFSVILTEHNSEEYMHKMLVSINNQTFQDFELIIVCDKCSDNTVGQAELFSYHSRGDKIITTDFGRCGLARNAALDIASGKWILFSDDDDWWLHDYAFEMIAEEAKNGGDVVAFGFLARDFCDQPGLQCFYSHPQNLSPFFRPWAAPWTKAWRREFIGDHRFPDIAHSDDLPFTQEMMPLIEEMHTIYQPLYFYNYMRPGSIQDRLRKGELK